MHSFCTIVDEAWLTLKGKLFSVTNGIPILHGILLRVAINWIRRILIMAAIRIKALLKAVLFWHVFGLIYFDMLNLHDFIWFNYNNWIISLRGQILHR
jgi:hypothetical protein